MSKNKFYSFAFGVGTKSNSGNWLEVFYPSPAFQPDDKLMDIVTTTLGYQEGNAAVEPSSEQLEKLASNLSAAGMNGDAALCKRLQQSAQSIVITMIAEDIAPETVPEVYLKLHLLSHRLVKPHETNLTGMFGLLPNVAWTNKGAIAIDELPERQLDARLNGELLEVMSVDKFPKMANYTMPSGVRVADTDRVRLGAHLGDGTTVMHEGFVNFNAGTLGTSMVEGRISAGVVVGHGSDLGGGCSTMGTLSGGNNVIIYVGDECLIGANAGIGIPLGDRCTVEAGLYVTAGSKVTVLDENNQPIKDIKARDLAGKPDLLLRRNSQNGRIECKTNKSAIALNEELHANN